MPPLRKIDLIPQDLREWLEDELKARGFGGYVDLTAALNDRLAERGEEIRLGKSAVHSYGQEYEVFAKLQKEASTWASSWMVDNGIEAEAKQHTVLFNMIMALAFKVMQAQMLKEGDDINPQQLAFLGKLMKDVMSSSGMREKMSNDERRRIADEARESERAAMVAKIDGALNSAKSAGMTREVAEKVKAEILGISA